MADELGLIDSWIYSTLAADTATLIPLLAVQTPTVAPLGIFMGAAVQGAKFPLIVAEYISPIGFGDFMAMGARRVWTRARYRVAAIVQGTAFKPASIISSRIDVLIHRGSGTPTGGLIISCVRESPYRETEVDDAGNEYRKVGAYWAITVRATS